MESKQEALDRAKKEVTPVVTGNVKKKKKSEIKKFTDVFVAEDIAAVKDFVFYDVVVPAFKNLIFETGKTALEMLMWGSTGHGRTVSGGPANRVNYNKISTQGGRFRDSREPQMVRSRQDYNSDEFEFATRQDAEAVLNGLDDIIETYGHATIADMCELANMSSKYTDQRYGWYDLATAKIVRTRYGYFLDMPRAVVIER